MTRRKTRTAPPPPDPARWILAAAVLAVLSVVALRVHLADLPLERDEGEYAYGGQLLLRGGALFRDLYTLKFPGAHAACAAILLVLGETPRAVRLGLLLFNLGAAAALFFLARRLYGTAAAAVAAAALVLLSASLAVLGPFAHATQLQLLPLVAGMLALQVGLERKGAPVWLALAGVLLGLAVLVKQHAAVFLVLAAGLVLARARRQGRGWGRATGEVLALGGGAAVPMVALGLVLAAAGTFDAFWFWCFRYARDYVGLTTLGEGFPMAGERLGKIAASSPFLVLLALWGAVSLRREKAEGRGLVLGWVLAGLAAAAPGLYFREHYFVPVLPALALLAGAGAAAVPLRSRALVVPSALLASALYPLWHDRAVLLEPDHAVAMHRQFGSNPFPEAAEIARYLRREAAPGDRVAVLGSEPEIPFLSGLPSATGYVYMYGLLEPHPHARAMQDDLIRRLEAAPPRFVVHVRNPVSWMGTPQSEMRLLEWIPGWLQQYEVVGLAEMLAADRTRYLWGEAARRTQPRSSLFVQVLRRKET